MKMIIDELVTLLGLEIAPGVLPKIQKFEAMLGNVVKTVGYVSTGLTAAASGIVYFAERMNQSTAGLTKIGQLSGLNTDKLQQMNTAVIMAGGATDGLADTIAHLNESVNPVRVDDFNMAWGQLFATYGEGVDDMSNVWKSLDKTNELFQHMKPVEASSWAKKIGIDSDLLMLLLKPVNEYERIMSRSGKSKMFPNEKESKDAQNFTIQMRLLHDVIDKIGAKVSSVAAPAMEKLTGDISLFIEKHQDTILTVLQPLMDGIIKGFADFGGVLKTVYMGMQQFKTYLENNIPVFKEFEKGLTSVNIISKLVYWSLIALSSVIVGMGASLLLSHPYILLISGAVLLIANNWDKASDAFNNFFYIVETKWRQLKTWLDDITGQGKQGANYDTRFGAPSQDQGLLGPRKKPGVSILDSAQSLLSHTFAGALYQHLKPTQAASHTLTFNQYITGDAIDVAPAAKHGVMDALSQTFPGLMTTVVN